MLTMRALPFVFGAIAIVFTIASFAAFALLDPARASTPKGPLPPSPCKVEAAGVACPENGTAVNLSGERIVAEWKESGRTVLVARASHGQVVLEGSPVKPDESILLNITAAPGVEVLTVPAKGPIRCNMDGKTTLEGESGFGECVAKALRSVYGPR